MRNGLSFQHLSAGTLIKQEKERYVQLIERDSLRFTNINDNQKFLIDGFHHAKDVSSSLVILDGHTVIDTPNGLEAIPASVFIALEIQMFVFLNEDSIKIKTQRANDKSRD